MLLNCGVGEDSWESHGLKPVSPKGNQFWIFIGRTDAEAEIPILWPLGVKNWLIGKDPNAGKDWRQENKVMTEDEMVGWHHQLHGHEFEESPGVGDGQGSLTYCSPWGHKESDLTEQLKWTELMMIFWLGRIIVQLLRKVYIFTSISIYILFYGLNSHFTSEENETLGGKCLIECLTLEI